MKKTKFLIIAMVFWGINTFPQITVTDADLIGVGDIIYQAWDTTGISSAINVGNAGANQTWDFSSLQASDWDTTNVISPTGTPYANMYPNANLCFQEDGEYYYINKSTNGVEVVGIDNFPINMLLSPLPLTYGLTYSDGPNTIMDSSMVNMFLPDSLALFISSFQAHKIDSMKVVVTLTNDFNVDAWGDVTIPMGTYSSLRVNAQEVTTTSFSAYCTDTLLGTGSGWYPIPQQIFPSETDAFNHYQWWTNDPSIKFVVADLEVDSAGNVIDASFLTIPQAVAVTELAENTIKVFPIPSTYQLNIEANSTDLATYKIYDISGRLILENTFSKNTRVDLNNKAKGSYLLNISTEKGSITKKIIVE